MPGVVARQAAEPTLGEDLRDTRGAAVEAGESLEVIEGIVDEVVFFGADDGVVAKAAEGGTYEGTATLSQVRPLAGGKCKGLGVHIVLVGGHENAGILRQSVSRRVCIGLEFQPHDGRRCQLHSLQPSRRLRGDLAKKARRGRSRGSYQHAIKRRRIGRCSGQAELLALASDAGDKSIEVDLGAGLLGQCLIKLRVAAAESLEDGAAAAGRGRAGLLQRADRGRESHWAALGQRVEGLRQRRDGRAQTQIIGRTGVHAAEEGGDNVVDEVVAKLLAHQLACGNVAARRPLEGLLIVDAARGLGRDQMRDRLRVRRNAHHSAARQRLELAGVHQRVQTGGLDQAIAETEGFDKFHGIAPAGEEGLGAHVGRAVVKRHRVQLATDPAGGLENLDVVVAQLVSGRQARQAGTDNRNTHLALLVDDRYGAGDCFRVSSWQDPVAEVPDVAVNIAALARPIDLAADGAYGLAHGVVAGKKHGWVKVALQHAGAHALSRGIHGYAIIDTYDLRPRLRHCWQELAGADTEVDARNVHAGQDFSRIRQNEFAVVTLVEVARPGIEKLHGVDAGVDLHLQEAGDGRHQAAHEQMPGLRLGVHEGLGALVVLRRPALNEVASQRERRTNEADKRLGFGELGQDAGDAFSNLGDVGL